MRNAVLMVSFPQSLANNMTGTLLKVLVFCGGLGGFAAFIVIKVFLFPLYWTLAARNWSLVPCIVIESRVLTVSSKGTATHRPEIVFRYRAGNREFTSKQYSFFNGMSGGREAKEAVVSSLPAGSTTICFVNPADPSMAVMNRSVPMTLAWAAIPLIFALVCGIGFGVATMRLIKRY